MEYPPAEVLVIINWCFSFMHKTAALSQYAGHKGDLFHNNEH